MNVSGSSMNMNSRGNSSDNANSMIKSGLGMGSTRDSRAQEAIRMKDEQLRILTDQNSHLLKSLDQVEEEANTMQLEKLAIEERKCCRETQAGFQ